MTVDWALFFDSRRLPLYTLWGMLHRTGLPQELALVGTYREGMATDSLDPVGIYVGTNTGKIFASNDEGDSWHVLTDHLPPVYSVSARVLESRDARKAFDPWMSMPEEGPCSPLISI